MPFLLFISSANNLVTYYLLSRHCKQQVQLCLPKRYTEVPTAPGPVKGTMLFSCSVMSDSFRDSIDCSPPGSFVHGISQARILEQGAISFSRGSFWPKDQTQIYCIGRWILYHWATWEAQRELYPVPENVILLGNRIFAGIIELRWGHTLIYIKNKHMITKGEGGRRDKLEIWN